MVSRLSKQPRVSTSSFRRTKTTEIKRSLPLLRWAPASEFKWTAGRALTWARKACFYLCCLRFFWTSSKTDLEARSFVVWHSSKNKQEKSRWIFLCQPSNLHISVCLWHFLFWLRSFRKAFVLITSFPWAQFCSVVLVCCFSFVFRLSFALKFLDFPFSATPTIEINLVYFAQSAK